MMGYVTKPIPMDLAKAGDDASNLGWKTLPELNDMEASTLLVPNILYVVHKSLDRYQRIKKSI